MKPRTLFACTLAGLLGACQTVQPPPPPLLTVTAAECAATPLLAQASVLSLNPEKVTTETADIGLGSACLQDGGGSKRLYALFRLPDSAPVYTVAVASVAHKAVFALRIALLDGDGNKIRDIDGEALMFRGGALTGLFRPRADERYLLVASDPEAVGKEFSRTTQSMSTNMVSAGTVMVQVSQGADRTTQHVYSHSGRITVSVQPPTQSKK